MSEPSKDRFAGPSTRRRLIVAGLALLGIWFVFLDSHSLLKRVEYARERAELIEEVERLREANAVLETRLQQGVTDELIERVAREDYGMRRDGETVYPVEKLAD